MRTYEFFCFPFNQFFFSQSALDRNHKNESILIRKIIEHIWLIWQTPSDPPLLEHRKLFNLIFLKHTPLRLKNFTDILQSRQTTFPSKNNFSRDSVKESHKPFFILILSQKHANHFKIYLRFSSLTFTSTATNRIMTNVHIIRYRMHLIWILYFHAKILNEVIQKSQFNRPCIQFPHFDRCYKVKQFRL